MKKVFKRRRSGFTLLEMSIVLFIISLLILIVLPNLAQQRRHANRVHGDAMVAVVQTQIDAYENEHGTNRVSYAQLQADDYLTKAQVAHAQREQIVIANGKAYRR